MSFHVRKHNLVTGKVTYRIRYYSEGKHKTLPPDMHPQFNSLKEAEEFCKQQNAKADADRHLEKHAKGMDHLEWKKKYASFSQEVAAYLIWYKKKAPNSWETNKSWLENYIIPYFLGKGLNNPNLWHREFETFKDWLDTEAMTLGGAKLSYSSMGHIIKALNSFLNYLGLYNKMDAITSKVKCENPFRKLTKSRGKEDLISDKEYQTLKTKLGPAKEFIIILMNSGMRLMELYSLQFTAIEKGSDGIEPALRKPPLRKQVTLEYFSPCPPRGVI